MPVSNVFHPITVARSIERDAANVLVEWFSTYLKEIELQQELQSGYMKVPTHKNVADRNSFDDTPASELPRIIIISPGIIGTPRETNKRQYSAIWRLGIGIAWADRSEDEADFKCKIYAAAVRAILLQKGGSAIGGRINWIDEQYVDIPTRDQLVLAKAANVWFSVDLENVVTARGGPDVADQPPPYVYPTADTVDVVLEKEQ